MASPRQVRSPPAAGECGARASLAHWTPLGARRHRDPGAYFRGGGAAAAQVLRDQAAAHVPRAALPQEGAGLGGDLLQALLPQHLRARLRPAARRAHLPLPRLQGGCERVGARLQAPPNGAGSPPDAPLGTPRSRTATSPLRSWGGCRAPPPTPSCGARWRCCRGCGLTSSSTPPTRRSTASTRCGAQSPPCLPGLSAARSWRPSALGEHWRYAPRPPWRRTFAAGGQRGRQVAAWPSCRRSSCKRQRQRRMPPRTPSS